VGVTPEPPAASVLTSLGVEYRVVEYEPVSSLEEAAAQRGISPADIVKTIVVRISDESYVFVLVPGDRAISWPKLRAHLGTKRLSLPDPATAQAVTGYVRGTITPLGSTHAWPVVADASMLGRAVALGSGAPHTHVLVDADALVAALSAAVVDVTEVRESAG
jgi:Cys-tRNA(Pro)/Cys-tRNA(Cys) deacylase